MPKNNDQLLAMNAISAKIVSGIIFHMDDSKSGPENVKDESQGRGSHWSNLDSLSIKINTDNNVHPTE